MKAIIPFFHHDLGEEELASIREVFAGPILTTGDFVARFEKGFAEFLGTKHVLGVTSCTGALHLAMVSMGIGKGDEVITTPLTFVATAEAIVNTGANPVFVDVEADTGNINAELIEAAITPRTKAIIAVHLYGLMSDMNRIRAIADKHGLKVIEDAAHCIEGQRDGRRVGELADAACFSFFATKNITCGEGGAVSTNDTELFERMRRLRTHGMNKTAADRYKEGFTHWDVVESGWKYNMSNIEAAILLPQLKRILPNLEKRQSLAEDYIKALNVDRSESGLSYSASRSQARHARHLFTVWVPPEKRDAIINKMQASGVPCVVNYRPVHLLTWYQEHLGYKSKSFPNAEMIGSRTISLPLFPTMPKENVAIVVEKLKAALT